MNWEELTSPDFEKAVETCGGVCLLPFGVIEKHGDHLPLGQDLLYIRGVCQMAAKEEPAMVFPQYYFGQILEAQHVPGTIALGSDLLLPLLEKVCDEIGRNGFHRIIIVNGHGGNGSMLGYFMMTMLGKEKPYMVYNSGFDFRDEQVRKVKEAKIDGHGGEGETCATMYLHPELSHPERFADYGKPLGRFDAYRKAGLQNGIWWYADFPGHFAGEKVRFTRAKGKVFVQAHARHLAKQIRLVKSDDTPRELYQEFRRRCGHPANRYP